MGSGMKSVRWTIQRVATKRCKDVNTIPSENSNKVPEFQWLKGRPRNGTSETNTAMAGRITTPSKRFPTSQRMLGWPTALTSSRCRPNDRSTRLAASSATHIASVLGASNFIRLAFVVARNEVFGSRRKLKTCPNSCASNGPTPHGPASSQPDGESTPYRPRACRPLIAILQSPITAAERQRLSRPSPSGRTSSPTPPKLYDCDPRPR